MSFSITPFKPTSHDSSDGLVDFISSEDRSIISSARCGIRFRNKSIECMIDLFKKYTFVKEICSCDNFPYDGPANLIEMAIEAIWSR